MMDINADLHYWFLNSLIKKTSGSGIKNESISIKRFLDLATRQLAEEFHKAIIRKFNKIKVQSPFICNIWGG